MVLTHEHAKKIAHTHTHTHPSLSHTHTHTYTYAYIHTYKHAHTHTHINTHTHTHTHPHRSTIACCVALSVAADQNSGKSLNYRIFMYNEYMTDF